MADEYESLLGGKSEFLPDNFQELMREGDFEKLKSVYDICAIQAHVLDKKWRWKNALYIYTPCSEFYQWLVDQGLDINAEVEWHTTPLTEQSGYFYNNVEGLIKAGANPDGTKYKNPMFIACRALLKDVVEVLIRYGAGVNVPSREFCGITPLDVLLKTTKYERLPDIYAIAEMLMAKNATSKGDPKKLVEQIGQGFEFRKSSMDADKVAECEPALEKLYKLFGVEPVKKIVKHDGISPIKVAQKDNKKAFEELWESLVPSKGKCETVQGEMIRIAGKLGHWLEEYSGDKRRWKTNCAKMLEALPKYYAMGKPLPPKKAAAFEALIAKIDYDSEPEDEDPLRDLAVDWVRKNPDPIKLGEVNYKA